LSAFQLFLFLPCPSAHDEPFLMAVGLDAHGNATRRLAEVLASEGRRPKRAELLIR
jgi:hypothetical protein